MKYIDNIDFSKIKTHSDIGQSEVDGLDVVKEAMDLKKLVDDPKKLKTFDTHISPDEALKRLQQGETDEYLLKVVIKDPITAFAYVERVLKKPFPLGEPIIASRPYTAYHYAEEVLEGPFPLGEPVIAKNAHTSLAYAHNILKGPFPLGEPAIAKDRNVSIVYARDVLNGPFPLAEPKIYNDVYWRKYYEKEVLKGRPWTNIDQKIDEMDLKKLVDDPKKLKTHKTHISPKEAYERLENGEKEPYLEQVVAKDATCSYYYARYVLKKPFPLGEPTIAKNGLFSYHYAKNILNKPFPLGEPVIARDPNYSFDYAKDVLKGPFALGEPALYNSIFSYSYEKHVLRGRPWTGLDQKVTEAMDLKGLVDDPNKLQTKDTHLGPKDALKKLKFGATDSYLYDILAQDPHSAVDYVDWYYTWRQFEGEPFANSRISKSIATSPGASLRYAEITNKPFAEGEPAIARDYLTSYYYAMDVLKGPFPLGEPAIYNSNYKDKYAMKVLRGKLWTGLDQKVTEAINLKDLVDDPKKLKTHDTHISPVEAYQRLKKGEKDEYLSYAVAKDPKYSYYYVRDILNKPFPLGEPAIAKDGWYSYIYARDILNKPFPLGEPAIAKDAMYSYRYAKYVLKGKPWTGLDQKIDEAMDLKNLVDDPKKLKTHDTHISPKEAYERLLNGEKDEYLIHVVAKDAKYSYLYAADILKKPFPLGEPAIAKNASYSVDYARDVLKGPFPLGEPAIAKSAADSFFYAQDVLRKPFLLGQPAIARSSYYAYHYARHVLKKPWPLGEPAIAKDETCSFWYEDNVLKGKPWTSLKKKKVKESMDLKSLVDDPKKLQTYDTHISPKEALEKLIAGQRGKHLLRAVARNTATAYQYAKFIDKRFKLGEPEIFKSPDFAYQYARAIVKGRLKDAEPVILKYPTIAYHYARNVLNKPFPKAEKNIYNSNLIVLNPDHRLFMPVRRAYETYVLKGRPWTGLDQKVDEALDLKNLVDDPTKLKTHDTHISPDEALERLLQGETDEYLVKAVAINPRTAIEYAESILEGPFPEGEPAIAKNADYSFDYARLIGRRFELGEPAMSKDGLTAYVYAKYILQEPWPLGEPSIASSKWSQAYARTILQGRPWTGLDQKVTEAFDLKNLVSDPKKLQTYDTHISPKEAYEKLKAGELDGIYFKAVSTDPFYSLKTAIDVLEGPFPLGEPAIATSSSYSLLYALNVLKDRFILGEPSIATIPYTALEYARRVIKGPFPLAEPTFATSAGYSFMYAKHILHGPFPLGEKAIYNSEDTGWLHRYVNEITKGRPWTGLDQKVDEALDLKNLVDDPKKLQTHDTHISPKEAYRRLKKGETDEYLLRAVAKDAEYSFHYAADVLKKSFPLGEPTIAKDAGYSCLYAVEVLKGPFPLGEPIIATDTEYSLFYAMDALKGPFPLGEPAIKQNARIASRYRHFLRTLKNKKKTVKEAIDLKNLVDDPKKLQTHDTHISPKEAYERLSNGETDDYLIRGVAKDAEFSYIYARYVLEKPFPLGEPAIAKNAGYSYYYADYVLKKPFPLGEYAIARSVWSSYYYATNVLKGPFPLGEPAIYNSGFKDRYETNVLKGRPWTGLDQKVDEALDLKNLVTNPKKLKTHDTHMSPKEAFERLKKGETDECLLRAVAKDKNLATEFARFVLKGPFPLGEPVIAKDAYHAYHYVSDVLKGPFPLGEPAMAKDPVFAFAYAKDTLKGPFPLGEPAIAKDIGYAYAYARDVLKGPFPLGEPEIAKNLNFAYYYARDVLKGPFPLGEPVIRENPYAAKQYKKNILKGRPWTGLDSDKQ